MLDYKSKLTTITQDVNFLMSLYVSPPPPYTLLVSNSYKLHPSVTPEVIAQAAKAGVTGVKLYPQGMFDRPTYQAWSTYTM